MEYVITFKNTNFAIKAERCLLEQKLHITVMPLPSQVRAGCGICLRVPEDEIETALTSLTGAGITETELYSRVKEGNGFVYTEVK